MSSYWTICATFASRLGGQFEILLRVIVARLGKNDFHDLALVASTYLFKRVRAACASQRRGKVLRAVETYWASRPQVPAFSQCQDEHFVALSRIPGRQMESDTMPAGRRDGSLQLRAKHITLRRASKH